MSSVDIWAFRTGTGHVSGTDLIGFKVEATDGHIGKIDRLSEEVDDSYLVVDTGPWIFGKHVLLPAGTVARVDLEEEVVHVDRTKDEIKHGPEYVAEKHGEDPDYRERYAGYYGPFYGGPIL
ncbi:PRC-barrel domain-containing protein [Kitasatospora sp. NPDC096147]|uniref:PRC-barrel domain-containing protein n=1 Tax=Kitasatospora sp. NPDC096147 TaxID=3364093 RepID=UPI00380C6B3C